MYSNLTTYNKFSVLTKPVILYDKTYEIKSNILCKSLLKYYQKNIPVYLYLNGEYHPTGKISEVSGTEVSVSMMDNQYGYFMQRMLYYAVDYHLVAKGVGQISYDAKTIIGFRLSKLIIADYTKWF
jgi:hypothetical protein